MQGQRHLARLQDCRDLFGGKTTLQVYSHMYTTSEEKMTQNPKESSKGSSFFIPD